jgi:hypothetical protein
MDSLITAAARHCESEQDAAAPYFKILMRLVPATDCSLQRSIACVFSSVCRRRYS